MPAHIVQCRVCKQKIEIKQEEKDVVWIMPSKLWYYHMKCYDEWKNSKEHDDRNWNDMIFDLIARDLKGEYNFMMVQKQIDNFVNKQMTKKGIYFTLYFHYVIKNNKWQSQYGIGIVPNIYKEATSYWIDREDKKSGILDQIKTLAEKKIKEEPIVIQRIHTRKKKNIKAPT